jgi:CRP/FNR family transcriptional regulator
MFTENTMAQRSSAVWVIADATVAVPTLQSLFSGEAVERFESGTAVFWEGDEAKHVFQIVEGVLRVFKLLSDGRRVITGFLYPGDLLGVSLKDQYLYTAEAVMATKLRRFGRTRFQNEINRSPELRPQLFARLCDEMAAAQDQMVLLARKSAEERVSSFLLLIARRLVEHGGATPTVAIPMTRLDMADYLGLTLETVSRTLSRLVASGVIAPSGRHAFSIRKPGMLALMAGESEDNSAPMPGAAAVRQATRAQ